MANGRAGGLLHISTHGSLISVDRILQSFFFFFLQYLKTLELKVIFTTVLSALYSWIQSTVSCCYFPPSHSTHAEFY